MTFTTPCFVRVEDAAERQKLIEWLLEIGHKSVIANDSEVTTIGEGHIDCGTNVDLFRALAAMNDDNDREQWFVVDDGFEEEMVCSKSEVDYDYILSCYDHRKATVEEIMEHFEKK